MALRNIDLLDRTIEVGGPELLTYRRIVMRVMYAIGASRPIVSVPFLLLRAGAWYFDGLFARWPFTEHWVDMMSTPQTAELGNIERLFAFRPAAFDIGLIDQYLENQPYLRDLVRYAFTTRW